MCAVRVENTSPFRGKREYVIEGKPDGYPEGSTLFGSCVAGRFQLVEYEDGEIMGGGFFDTLEEARAERKRAMALDKDQS